MSDISPASIKVMKSLEEQLQGATNSEQIKEIMKSAAVAQNLAHREWDESIVTPNEPSAVPQKVGKVIVINGVTHSLIGSETEILAQENALMRTTFSPPGEPAVTTQQTEQSRDEETGRFLPALSDEDAALQAELRTQMMRGDLTPEDYLLKSGTFDRYTEQRELKQTYDGWKSATDAFLASPEGQYWPGGDALNRIGEIIAANHLEAAEDKLDVLKQAWALMQAETAEEAITKTVIEINDPYTLRNALQGGRDSSMFRR